MKYGIINTKNPEYNELETQKLQLLYKGGNELADNSHLFIHKDVCRGENDIVYHERLKCVSYRNYMANIVNDYVSDLFSKSFSVMPAADADKSSSPGKNISKKPAKSGMSGEDFYHLFAEDTDLKNHNLSYVLADIMSEALVSGKAYIGVDFPKVDAIPRNLAEEEASKADRAYTYCVPTLSVIDWDIDPIDGHYRYVVIKSETIPRKSFSDTRDKRIIQFKVWEKADDTGIVSYRTFEIAAKLNKEPNDKDEVAEVPNGSGIVSFKEIPILCLDMPSHLWIGNLIGLNCKELLERSSELVWAEKKSLLSIPVYKQGAELGAGDKPAMSAKGEDVNRGETTSKRMGARGWAVIGPMDEISFAEPEGKAYTIVDQQLKELIDAIKDITHQMANSTAAKNKALDRSGLSKQMDNHSKELVLSSYANMVKDFATSLYTLISEGRNENIVWAAVGMDNFQIIDRPEMIAEAVQISLIPIPSKTWKKHYLSNLALSITNNVSAAEQLEIKNEIDEYVDAMSDEDLMPPVPGKEDDSDKKKVKDKNKDGE